MVLGIQSQYRTQTKNAGIRWSSPTQLLVRRSEAYVWQSGRDAQFSSVYGRMRLSSLETPVKSTLDDQRIFDLSERPVRAGTEPRTLNHRHSIDAGILGLPSMAQPNLYAMSSPPQYPIPPRKSSLRPGSAGSSTSQGSYGSHSSRESRATQTTPHLRAAKHDSKPSDISLPLRPKSTSENDERDYNGEAAEVKLPVSSDEEEAGGDEDGGEEDIKSVDATEIKLPSSDYDENELLEATDIGIPSSIHDESSAYQPKVKFQSPELSDLPEIEITDMRHTSTTDTKAPKEATKEQSEGNESRFTDRLQPSMNEDGESKYTEEGFSSFVPPMQSKPSMGSLDLPRTISMSSIPSINSPTHPRRSGMTLKEQSTTIDRLSKENWDLKLKITFLNSALNDRSDEAIKDMIAENVELKASLFSSQKEVRNLRKTVKSLQDKLTEREDGDAQQREAENAGSDDEKDSRSYREVELEEEVTYYRSRIEAYEREMERIRKEGVTRENETRRLADAVRSMGERRGLDGDIGVREEIDMWKDMYETEAARREQADEDARKLRQDLQALKSGRSSSLTPTDSALHKSKRLKTSNSRPASRETEQTYAHLGGSSDGSSSTLVEQLRHENAELRREVGAQTSMLTSRNRERERLYQEIEDLKYNQRRADGGRSVAGESIFERSASRVNQRNFSRAGAATRMTQLSDPEKEELENKNDALRDQVLELRLKMQEIERNYATMENRLGLAESEKLQHQQDIRLLENDLTVYNHDLSVVQAQRDEALAVNKDKDVEYEDLRSEAQQAIDKLEEEIDQKIVRIENLELELENRNEDFKSLQNEMRMLSESLVRLEDEQQSNAQKVQNLEEELDAANQDIESYVKSIDDSNQKVERLEVQLESHEGEIAFLREEQDADKIKIGELEGSLTSTQSILHLEQEKANELGEKLGEERYQREVVLAKEREDKLRIIEELNREVSNAKDEKRKLKKSIAAKEAEALTWKQRLAELENGLRETLGDANGTRTSLIESVIKLQKMLSATMSELDITKNNLSDKERLLQNRDTLLENTALESKKLSDLLDHERQGRRQEKAQFEKAQRTHLQTMRTMSQQETRIMEFENARQQERRKAHNLEQQYKSQLEDRNTLLLALFNRLSTLCGSDWSKQNCNINGQVPSLEVIAAYYPNFSKTIILAMKTVEGVLGGVKTRIRAIERDLTKDYQELERNVQGRFKRLERIEGIVATRDLSRESPAPGNSPTFTSLSGPEIAKIRTENKRLKAELKHMIQQHQQLGSKDQATPYHLTRSVTDPPFNTPRVPSPGTLRRTSLLTPSTALNKRYSASAAEHAFNTAANAGTGTSGNDAVSSSASKSGLRDGNGNRPGTGTSGRELSLSRQRHHQRDDSTSSNNAAPAPDVPTAPKDTSPSATTSDSASEKRWRERLKEMERRLKAEREARLLDRSGARQRLEEGRAQNDALREELERERVRRE
ncbi:hypothetical protein L228DRAFT_237583 [Xylona heveae TC161]|uniref:Anucleate primary sterigmata protein B n=1 Tax=Xylona heveae (strain CBS 132557 / TC161) TaxID=1328760 RepID=A0A165IBQ3_XYLHT|nr:hypothetical protein L228DRAFT_237583 [Xylona heveae TC161]KZF24678.1 hypothetical protein L228DRAFT_237583 [Xylona heveae TC161]